MATVKHYGILRSDRNWYCGTVDKEPIFADPLVKSGVFTESGDAWKRVQALIKRPDQHDYTFEVIPVHG
jgi:hypothetical protein